MNKTRPELTLELNDLLWNRGWASFRTDRSSGAQKYGCDLVAMKGGKIRFVTIEHIKAENSKVGVSSKISNLKDIEHIAKPLSHTQDVDYGWVLAIYIGITESWVGIDKEMATVKPSDGYEPITQVM